ncbi:MAG: putative molybdenum carrier protein [Alphaproteobacteria bacterium]|nr:putative molybdenum carrier protein [Alphaproteobacteria bacterium]
MLTKIVSGGQTGVDRAALDAALAAGLEAGGWCPHGRRAEDGAIPAVYPLTETPHQAYRQRTEWNVRDSDATLILVYGAISGGTALTVQFAHTLGRPHRIVRLDRPGTLADEPAQTAEWIAENKIAALNVAGPRESHRPGIQNAARAFMAELIAETGARPA